MGDKMGDKMGGGERRLLSIAFLPVFPFIIGILWDFAVPFLHQHVFLFMQCGLSPVTISWTAISISMSIARQMFYNHVFRRCIYEFHVILLVGMWDRIFVIVCGCTRTLICYNEPIRAKIFCSMSFFFRRPGSFSGSLTNVCWVLIIYNLRKTRRLFTVGLVWYVLTDLRKGMLRSSWYCKWNLF